MSKEKTKPLAYHQASEEMQSGRRTPDLLTRLSELRARFWSLFLSASLEIESLMHVRNNPPIVEPINNTIRFFRHDPSITELADKKPKYNEPVVDCPQEHNICMLKNYSSSERFVMPVGRPRVMDKLREADFVQENKSLSPSLLRKLHELQESGVDPLSLDDDAILRLFYEVAEEDEKARKKSEGDK